MTQVTAVSFDAKTGNYFAKVGGKTIKSYSKKYVEKRLASMVGDIEEAVAVATEKQNRFNINERFSFVEKLVTMVANNVQPSAVITGEGGLGKTYTVTKTLESNGLKDISDLADFQVGNYAKYGDYIWCDFESLFNANSDVIRAKTATV